MPMELELQVVMVLLAWDGCWALNSCCLKGPCVPLTTGPSLWGQLAHFSKVIYAQYYKFLVNLWAFLFELKSAINSLPHVWMDFFFSVCAALTNSLSCLLLRPSPVVSFTLPGISMKLPVLSGPL